MKHVYIAGPYSKGDTVHNIHAALQAAETVVGLGCEPYIPHLTAFWHLVVPHNYEFWMARDEAWLLKCDAVLRIPGESEGADREVGVALLHGIPVYLDIKEMKKGLLLGGS